MTFRIRVHYPLNSGGSVLLRTEADWDRDIEPTDGGSRHFDFRVESSSPFLYFKPVLRERTNGFRWSVGENYLALSEEGDREIYPYFDVDDRCSVCEIREAEYRYRVFYPPGYHENVLERFPVLYMHDAQNLFFREEAFQGYHWRIAETLSLLDAMNLVRKVLVVGIYPNDRETDYTKPGYEQYGRFLVEWLKPEIDRSFRTLPGPESTGVMGSSLGGVASFFMAWQWPEVFGMAACLSSTFGWRDDLEARVENEPRRDVRFYLDSGWPKDNYEATRNMRTRLVRKGYRPGKDLFYLGFPEALHNETSWAMRCHVPFQFLFGDC